MYIMPCLILWKIRLCLIFLIVPSDSDGSLLYGDIFQTKFDESDVLIYDSKGENEDNGNVKYFTVK